MKTARSNTDVRVWRAPDLQAEMLRGRFQDFSYDTHTHDTACFALITRGALRIRMRGMEIVARKGDLYAIEADEPHAGWPVDDQGWRQRTVYVATGHLRSLLGARGRYAGSLKGPIITDPVLTAMLYGIHRCSELRGDALKRDEQYLSFAARLFQRHVRRPAVPTQTAREPRAVALAKDFLDYNLDRNVHLQDIARVSGLAPFRLFRAFERQLGMTPHGYQRQARIRCAIRHIRQGYTLSAAAAAAGFADQAHLTRCFRRAMGVTPGIYRKALLR